MRDRRTALVLMLLLSASRPVRLSAQGQELDELTPLEREANATCGEQGLLTPA